ncbi:MAG: hypothetical protein D6706_06475 [Chloroflexi bacterium]|nr:MAG: hypothetical protein D6706_06475 [Chloroflexota bacterium]
MILLPNGPVSDIAFSAQRCVPFEHLLTSLHCFQAPVLHLTAGTAVFANKHCSDWSKSAIWLKMCT